ncbi:unannotated protein [freshwater metagenome]|uniref:Unannotated protein n=1 Tax=freshwater metagenome TaxID=449393 RepID=A0A6J7EHI6_9ZZZZ|nr:DUF4192 family protein [Actinomycetota bacterium]
MSAESVENVITLSSPRDVLDAIPHSLGFYPGNSLVISLLKRSTKGRQRQVLVVRLDLLGQESSDVEDVDWVSVETAVSASGATAAVVAVFAQEGSQQEVQSAQAPLIDRVRTLMHELNLDLMDELVVADGCYTSLVCTDALCCPPEGTVYDVVDPGAIGVELAVKGGSSPLAGRTAVASQFQTDSAQQAAVLTQIHALEGCQAPSAEQILQWGSAVTWPTREVARTLLAFKDVAIRDAVIAGALCENAEREERLRNFFSHLVTIAPDGYRAAPATLASIAWWVDGDGARSNICLDIATADQGQYRLADLFKQIMRAAVPPDHVRELLAEAMSRASGE